MDAHLQDLKVFLQQALGYDSGHWEIMQHCLKQET